LRIPPRIRPALRSTVHRLASALISSLGWLRALLPSSHQFTEAGIRRILVIRLDLLGDVLFTLPAAEDLRARYPTAHISLLTLPYTAALARMNPAVDEVIALDTNRIRSVRGLLESSTWLEYARVWRRVRRARYDLCISACGRTASFCAFLSGAGISIGYAGESYPNMLTDRVPGGRYRERIPDADYVRHLATYADAEGAPDHLHLQVPETARRSVCRLLAGIGIDPSDRLVLIHAGAVNGSAKRWPARNWSRFAIEIQARTSARVLLTGAASDEPIARQAMAHAPGALSLVGKTSIEELAALIERADVMVSGDSGPLHLAVALGTPSVAAYGPTDPAVHGPYHPHAAVRLHRRADLPCSPCYTMASTAECPLGEAICMRLVTVQSMVASAIELLPESAGTSAGVFLRS